MPQCVFKSCKNNARKSNLTAGVFYSRFPSDPCTCAKWISIVARERKDEFYKPAKNSVICSDHFDTLDISRITNKLCRLDKTAVPKLQEQEPLLYEDEIKEEITIDEDFEKSIPCVQAPLLHEDEIKEEITIDEDFEKSIPCLLDESVKTEKDPLSNNQDQINFSITLDHDYVAPVSIEPVLSIPVVSSTQQGSINPTIVIGPLLTSHLPSNLCPKSNEDSSQNKELNNMTIRLQQEIALNATQKQNIEALKRKVRELHEYLKKRNQQIKSLKSEIRALKSKS